MEPRGDDSEEEVEEADITSVSTDTVSLENQIAAEFGPSSPVSTEMIMIPMIAKKNSTKRATPTPRLTTEKRPKVASAKSKKQPPATEKDDI